MNIGGTQSSTSVGQYTVSFSLKSTTNTEWTDGSTTAVSLTWSITKIQFAKPTLTNGSFAYTGSTIYVGSGTNTDGTSNFNNYDSTKMTLGGTSLATDAGQYTITFTLKDSTNYEWSDSTTNAVNLTWSINRDTVKIAKPTAVTGLVYNKSEQVGVPSGTGYVVTGGTAVNAGTHTATVKLEAYYAWELPGGSTSTADLNIEWSIAKAVVQKPTINKSTYKYDGTTHQITFTNIDAENVVVTGNEEQTNAGAYQITISLVDATNYNWNDNTNAEYVVELVITKISIEKPSLKNSTFVWNDETFYVMSGKTSDGTENVQNFNSTHMTKSGDLSASNIGEYAISFALKDSANYEWSDGSIADVVCLWSIIFQPTKIQIPTAITGLIYNKTEQTGVLAGSGYTITGNTATNAGTYTATAVLQKNYAWELENDDISLEDQQIEWEIGKISVEKPTTKKSTFTFDHWQHKIEWNAYDNALIKIEGNEYQQEIGTYDIQVSLRDPNNYKWAGELEEENESSPYNVQLIIEEKINDETQTEDDIPKESNDAVVIIALSAIGAGFVVMFTIIITVSKRKKKKKEEETQLIIRRRLK